MNLDKIKAAIDQMPEKEANEVLDHACRRVQWLDQISIRDQATREVPPCIHPELEEADRRFTETFGEN